MANQPSLIPGAWAENNSTTLSIPATTTESGKASWDQGFPVETSLPLSGGGIPPKYGDFNGILNVLSQFAYYAQHGGQYAWSNTLDYSVGCLVCGSDGNLYVAAQVSGPSSTAVNPVGDTSGTWTLLATATDLASYALDADVVNLTGTQTITGIKTFSNALIASSEDAIQRNVSDSSLAIYGGQSMGTGAMMALYGENEASLGGNFVLRASDNNNARYLNGKPDGTLQWDGKDFVYTSGDQTINGVKKFTSSIATTAYPAMYNPDEDDDNVLQIIAGHTTSGTAGAKLSLEGANVNGANAGGGFTLQAGKNGAYCQLIGKPDGDLTWGGQLVKNGTFAYSGSTTGGISFHNGTSASDGAGIWTYGKSHSSRPSWIWFQTYISAYYGLAFTGTDFIPGASNTYNLGTTNNRWKTIWQQNGSITGSDERIKTNIEAIPDDVLDAWGEVDWKQFQMRAAVKKKGESARLHTGMIAQRIDEAFKAHGVDVSRYGLFCHDEWDARPADYDENGEVTFPAIEAGDEYSLRYEEALCMEAAYQRRRADRAEARLTALERRLDEMEAVLAAFGSPVEQDAEQEEQGAEE